MSDGLLTEPRMPRMAPQQAAMDLRAAEARGVPPEEALGRICGELGLSLEQRMALAWRAAEMRMLERGRGGAS